MTLSELQYGQRATVASVDHSCPSLVSRIMALGLVPGEQVEVLHRAPLGDPMQIKAGSTYISVRRVDSAFISVSF
jgi:ferrous iron transport protein A